MRCIFIMMAALMFVSMPLRVNAAEYQRIVSINLCADQWLLELVEPERIAALSWLATDEGLSRQAKKAADFPIVRQDSEAILTLKPDLVLAGSYGTASTIAMLRQLNIPVVTLPYATTLAQIAQLSRMLGDILSVPERAEQLASHIEQTYDEMQSVTTTPKPVMLWREAGDVIGAGTLEDEVLQLAGGSNLATQFNLQGHMGLEQLVRLHPEQIILLSHYSHTQPSINNGLRNHPALRKAGLRMRHFPGNRFMCGEPGVVDTIHAMQRFLQPEASG